MKEIAPILNELIRYAIKNKVDLIPYVEEAKHVIREKERYSLEALEFITYFSNRLLNLNLTLRDILVIFMMKEFSQIRYFSDERDDSLKDLIGWLLLYCRFVNILNEVDEDYDDESGEYYYDYRFHDDDFSLELPDSLFPVKQNSIDIGDVYNPKIDEDDRRDNN